jgi:hypothetical protein
VSTRTAILIAAAALGVVAFALSGGGGPSDRVRALRADPMATYVPPGGRLVDTDSQNEGTTFGKPVFARYTRMFEIAPGTSDRALEDARTAAAAGGWAPLSAPSSAFPGVFNADKRLPSGSVQLAVTVFLDGVVLPEDVKPPALLISLRHNGP